MSGGKGDKQRKSYAVVIDYMDEPEPARASEIPTSFQDFLSFFDKVMPPIPVIRRTDDVRELFERKKPHTFDEQNTTAFLARSNGIIRAIRDAEKLRRPKTFLTHLFDIYGPNVEYGCSHEIRLPTSEEERVYYTLTSGFASQARPSRFVRKFKEIPQSLHIAGVLLTTMSKAAQQGTIMRVRNAKECLGLMVNDSAVRSSYEGAEAYSDSNGCMTSKGLFIASLLRKPKRLHEWANLPIKERKMDGYERAMQLSRNLSAPVNFLVHQGTRRLDFFLAKDATPEGWDNYVTGQINKEGMVVYARDLVWCKPIEACRGAIRTLFEHGFPPETNTTIMVPGGKEWKPMFTHTLSQLVNNASITGRMMKEAQIRRHTEEHPFHLR